MARPIVEEVLAEKWNWSEFRRELNMTGDYVDGALHDPQDKLYYFAPPGKKIPRKRSDYVLGTCLVVFIILLWVVAAVVFFVLRMATSWLDEVSVGIWLVTVPAGLLLLLMLINPFLSTRRSAAGKLLAGLRRGEILCVRSRSLAKKLSAAAIAGRPGYFDQAVALARADALREQAKQMVELSEHGAVAGPSHAELGPELADYAARLTAAADDYERPVRAYVEATHG